MLQAFVVVVLLALVAGVFAWLKERRAARAAAADLPVEIGGIYTRKGKDGLWRVSRILDRQGSVLLVRMYTNRYDEKPETVELSELSFGMGLEDVEALAQGRAPAVGAAGVPIDERGFRSDPTVAHLSTVELTQEERAYLQDLDEAQP